jgi:hypothetical protein
MKRFNIYSLGLGVLLLGLVPNSAAAFTLDLFTSGNSLTGKNNNIPYQKVEVNLEENSDSASDLDTSLSNVAWGQRQLDITASSSGLGTAQIEVIGGTQTRAKISSQAGVTIDSALFTWGFDSNTNYLDITDGGTHNVFNLNIITIDQNGADIKFRVTDSQGDFGEVIVDNITSNGSKSFAYNDIITNNSAVNLNSIKKVQMEVLNAPADFDSQFDFVQSAYDPAFPPAEIPFEFSPSLGIILCGSLFGVYKLRKRLQNN